MCSDYLKFNNLVFFYKMLGIECVFFFLQGEIDVYEDSFKFVDEFGQVLFVVGYYVSDEVKEKVKREKVFLLKVFESSYFFLFLNSQMARLLWGLRKFRDFIWKLSSSFFRGLKSRCVYSLVIEQGEKVLFIWGIYDIFFI